MNLEDALPTFIAESRELLDEMESSLLALDPEAELDLEAVNAIFRAAHTIKGSSGLFGLDHVVAFTHVAESVLDEVRAGRLPVSAPLVALLLRCCDQMRALNDEVAAGRTGPDARIQAQGEPLLAALREYLVGATAAPAAAGPTPAAAAPASPAAPWHIAVSFGPSVLRNGMDPLSFIRYLATIGRITHIVTLADALPAADRMDPENCYLGFEIDFETEAGQAQIEDVFEFAREDIVLRVTPMAAAAAPAAAPAATEARHDDEPAADKPREAAKARGNASVRVDSDKLDRLIDLVGELIIAQAGASLAAKRTADLELHEAHSTLASLVQEVRDSALQLRMVKIGATFNRFQRVVHDVSQELGKDIGLVVKGEDTELDKTVVEKIADPLTHLVRNAMDHGIEFPDARVGRGKPAHGTITLEAYHDAGNVVIEVRDDGRGLDRDRILAKGIERGLVEPDKALSDAEIYGLIFEPGFSTAEKVTNLSGRGVGMDVVKRNITALRGTVGIDSRPLQGTTVTVRLPLTLAIIDGFQIAVGRSVFVVPLETVEECVEYRPAQDDARDWTDLRGKVLPFIRLRRLFDLGGTPSARQNIVVLRYAGQKVGLVVDSLLGEAQTVIKPLSKMFAEVRGISGSSIRGTGDVALILDVPALIRLASSIDASQPVQN